MLLSVASAYTMYYSTIWIGRKVQFHKRLHRASLSLQTHSYLHKGKEKISKMFNDLTSTLKTTRTNDKRNFKLKTSARSITGPNRIMIKGKSNTTCLLIAYSLFDKSPLYSPSNDSLYKTRAPTESYLPIDNIEFAKSTPTGLGPDFNTNPSTVAFSADTGYQAYSTSFDSDSFKIGVDTCASACMSFCESDFITATLHDLPQSKGVKPYGKGPALVITKMGTIRWNIADDDGRCHKILVPNSILVPDGTERLLSPQHWAQQACKEGGGNPDNTNSQQFHNRNVLKYGNKGQFQTTIFNDKRVNVPYFYSAAGNTSYRAYMTTVNSVHGPRLDQLESAVCYPTQIISDDEASLSDDESSSSNQSNEEPTYSPINTDYTVENLSDFTTDVRVPLNIIEDEEEHTAATTDQGELLRWHYRLGHLSFNKLQHLATLKIIPGKLANVRKPKCACCMYGRMTRQPWRTKAKQGNIKTATKPGHCISVDQMESSTLGFIAQLKGRLTTRRYKYATIFIDHFSRYRYVHLQKTLTSEETLEAKIAFEAHARSMQVMILNYHADNGRFADNAWINDCQAKGQTISYCGVNAHWQNGIAEKGIRDLREDARTSLLHAIGKWPSSVTTHLWPYALRYSATIFNNLPKKAGFSPLELFSNIDVSSNMKNFHTFGCPVFALDNRLQAQKPVSSWHPRARLGINLGPSPRHARNVTMVLNMTTGCVSPQFHIQHDEFFETVNRQQPTPPAQWITLAGFTGSRANQYPAAQPRTRTPSNLIPLAQREEIQSLPPAETAQTETQSTNIDLQLRDLELSSNTDETATADPPTRANSTSEPTDRGRTRSHTQRIQESGNKHLAYSAYYDVLHEDDYIMQDQMCDPIAFKASSDPDTMYYHQAMTAPDRQHFLSAIVKEVNDHITNNHWALIPREEVPEGTKILDSIWAMKRKRDIKTREVYKHKARLNIHGGQQEYGVHYTETYSPVVNWFSVRLVTILSIINKWHTRQIDFVLAYPQAPLPYDNYMKLPQGIQTTHGNGDTHVLKLHKNIYGGRNSGRIWNEYLKAGLQAIGFTQSAVDECVFYRGKVIFLCYVDDGIFASPNPKDIDKAISDLSDINKAKAKFVIEDQGDIKDYLGINFEYRKDGTIKLSQPHLIEQIIQEVKLKKGDRRSTPAAPTKLLRRDENEPAFHCPFNYRRVIGQLNFLEKSSRPDIAYATHQCARFSIDPKESHVEAVIHLVKYLQATKGEGIILNPKANKSFEVYADADFAGNWSKSTAQEDPSTAKSRSGYVITYGDCPILWASKLQTCISLSTTEAEYVALSQCLRDTIPLMNLLQELKDREFHDDIIKPNVHCKAFEDNTGALELSKVPKMRPRTKHINNVYHHFRSYVRDKLISIFHVSTEKQPADIFTKPLPQNLFLKHRKKLLGF